MNKDKKAQNERFLHEAQRQLIRKGFSAEKVDDELLRVHRNQVEICLVDGGGSVRFRPKDATDTEADSLLRTVTQTVTEVGEYMRILERAPVLQAVGLDEEYGILADFSDTVLAARIGKKGAEFVTWEWDFDRRGVHTGHYFMEDYTAAKWDFAVRSGLVDSQRFFSDEQLEAIDQACEYLLMDGAMVTSEDEKALNDVRERIWNLRSASVQRERQAMEQTM